MRFPPAFLLFVSLLMPTLLAAALTPGALFGPYAILQRDRRVPVWGTADSGERVVVTFSSKQGVVRATDTADEAGRWRVMLGELPEGAAGELIFETEKGERRVSPDVLVGDVWLCGGQSNMEWTVRKSAGAAEAIAEADLPQIRQFRVRPAISDEPLSEPKDGKWVVCSPKTVGEFTALGFFVARDLFRGSGVPQGLINCSWGGTAIETWLSGNAYASGARPELSVVKARWEKRRANYPAAKLAYDQAKAAFEEEKRAAEAAGASFTKRPPRAPSGGPQDRAVPSRAFNAMLNPLAGYGVRAALWYQGEANWQFPREYAGLFAALIEDWRQAWGSPELPFVFMQLPGFGGDGTVCWPILREGQAAALSLPATSLVVTCDLGEPKEIHPANKAEFADRMAKVIQRDVFGESVVASGPVIRSARRDGEVMRVKLAGVGEGDLTPVLRSLAPKPGAFELAGEDRKFHPAAATLVADGREVIVRSSLVRAPVALRYAWRDFPSPVLFNKAGLPAAPFRTDDWLDKR
ncbi:sialate O-acetylesterase [Geminisphaera colitermitum]|uniref:sialate O-acetylesterase n=1 Tax=Geminisphaera colitermitum TaxID=1148786 RepID=UPI000158D391|nr:sialate O-acetylesterase [Geminisphaera colitermitum]